MPETFVAAVLLFLNALGQPFGLSFLTNPPISVETSISPTPSPFVSSLTAGPDDPDFPALLADTGVDEDIPAVFSNSLIQSVGINRLLFFVPGALGAIAPGQPGQFLQSQGGSLPPQWSDLSINNVVNNNYSNTNNNNTTIINNSGSALEWATPGVIGSTTPNAAFFTAISLAGGTYPLQIGGSNQFQVDNNGRLQVTYSGDSGFLSSNGGVFFINNTNNIGTGLGIYSNAGAEALGNMINVKVDNPLYDQAAFYMNYDGMSNAVEIVSNSNDGSSNALAVTGNNINDSTVGIIGYELARGTVKITHNRPGSGNDNSASALSIDLKGSGTRAQGVYVDSTEVGGTLGNLLRLRNQSIDRFVVSFEGNLTTAGNILQGANGTDTTFTKRGNVVGDEFFVGTNASFRIQRSASNSEAFRTQVAGDTQGRWVGTSDGRLRWGDGSSASDVTLRRSGPGALILEGTLAINTNLSVAGTTTFNSVAYTWPGSAGSNGQVLTTNGSGGLSWTTPSSVNYWQLNGAVVSPANSTFDLAIGGTATSSALFVVRGVTGNITQGQNGVNTTFTKLGNTAGDEFFIGTNGAFRSQRSLANSEAFRVQVAGDSQGRLVTTSDGRLTWGSGSAVGDTVLRRGDVGMLWLEGGLIGNNGNGDFDTVFKGASDGNLVFVDAGANKVGIGTSTPIGGLHIHKNGNGNAALIVNQLGGSDLLVASASGSTRFRVDNTGSVGVNATAFGTDAAGVLAIANSTAPTTSITNGIQLFAVDVEGSHELQVRDEAGNVTTLSPHNFSLIPEGRSEDLAWAFYSERGSLAINADMTKALRLIEDLTGEQLIYIQNLETGERIDTWSAQPPTVAEIPTAQTQLARYFSWGENLLDVLTEAVFKARVRFEQTVTFISQAVFKRGVIIEGEIVVDGSTAGWAEIPAGSQKVRITFDRAFSQTPTVFLDSSGLSVSASLENTTPRDFTIRLNQPLAQTTQIRWLAVVSQGSGASEVQVLGAEADTPESAVVPSPSSPPSQEMIPTPAPSSSPEPTLAPEAETATDSAIVTSQNP